MGLQVVDAKQAPGDGAKRAAPKRGERAIGVRGLNRDLPIRFAPETGAVPGERIVGILTPGEGITIYPIFARSLQNFDDEPDRWIDLTWDTLDDGQLYPARIKVIIHNEVGALAQVTGVIGENGGNIDNLQMVTRAQDFYDLEIVLEVHDVKHLNRIMQDLRLKPLVSSVIRMTG
jgi:(p)ppGpp synthase/HD superfamily hydrolase